VLKVGKGEILLIDALVKSELVKSKSDARRQIEQGGIKIEGTVICDLTMKVKAPVTIQKGKRFFVKLVV